MIADWLAAEGRHQRAIARVHDAARRIDEVITPLEPELRAVIGRIRPAPNDNAAFTAARIEADWTPERRARAGGRPDRTGTSTWSTRSGDSAKSATRPGPRVVKPKRTPRHRSPSPPIRLGYDGSMNRPGPRSNKGAKRLRISLAAARAAAAEPALADAKSAARSRARAMPPAEASRW